MMKQRRMAKQYAARLIATVNHQLVSRTRKYTYPELNDAIAREPFAATADLVFARALSSNRRAAIALDSALARRATSRTDVPLRFSSRIA